MAFNRVLLLLVIYVHCDTVSAQGHTKIWTTKDDKFLTLGNDDSECINQTFIYQKEAGIYFTIPEEINTIILPATGVLMFQKDQEIKFKAREAKCHSDSYNTNHFKLHIVQPMSWFNADNWRIKDSQQQNMAIPHIDRIPCECDVVEFPTNHSLWVDLDFMPQLTVKQVKINGRTDNFNRFLETRLGQAMFFFDQSTTFEEGMCEGTKTCGCHEPGRFAEYVDTVCLNSEVCHEPHCVDPIQPIGHCCPICGAMIQLTVDEYFCRSNFRSVNEYMELSVLMHDEFAGKVDAYVGMIRGDHDKDIKIQIIAVDKEDYDEFSVGFIRKLSKGKGFIKAMSAGGIAPLIVSSGRPYQPSGSYSAWFSIFTSLLLVLSMFGTIYLYYAEDSKLRKYNPLNQLRLFSSPFVFARFDNTRDDDTQSIAVGVEFEAQPTTSIYESIVSAFDNPMFKGRNKEKKIETIGPNVLNKDADDNDDGESVASVKLVEVELDSNEEC